MSQATDSQATNSRRGDPDWIASLKASLKRNKRVAGFVTSARRTSARLLGGMVTNYELARELAIFAPNSTGSPKARADLTILSAQQTFPLICKLIGEVSARPRIEAKVIESLDSVDASYHSAVELAQLFKKYGSDKAWPHNYYLFYSAILNSVRQQPLKVLEIGLGTNNRDVVSTMGKYGRPGASLRAFRDFLPNSEVFGADIDRRILFEEERIKTYFVDQTSLQSLDELAAVLPSPGFDLIIDDGLHSPNANIATLVFALKKLNPNGYFVVEDVAEASVPVWQTVSAILPEKYTPAILRGRWGFMFVVQKATSTAK